MDNGKFTPEQREEIAEIVKLTMESLSDQVFRSIGRTVVKKLFWMIGVLMVVLWAWLEKSGKI